MFTRSAQIGLKVQATAGTEETLAAADFAGNFKESDVTLDVNQYERDLIQASLARRPSLPGQAIQTITFMGEVVGGGAAVAAPFHRQLAGLSMASTQVKAIAVNAPSGGTFKIGQTIGNATTLGASTKIGKFVKYSNGKIFYVPVTSAFISGDTLYNFAATQVSALSTSGPANGGFAFSPVTATDAAPNDEFTVEKREGGVRYTVIGARATGTYSAKLGEPLLFKSEFKGAPVFDSNGISPRIGAAITAVPVAGVTPVVNKNVTLIVRTASADYKPVLTALEVNLNNTLASRETINDNSYAGSGYLDTLISGREYTATIDPEYVLPAVFDFIGFINAGTTFEMIHEVGAVTHGNGMFIMHGPAVQLTGSPAFGDRNGVRTVGPTVKFTGTADDEIFFYHLFG